MSILTDQLRKYKNSFDSSTSSEILEIISRNVSLLQKQNILANCLNEGDVVLSKKFEGSKENCVVLDKLLSKTPLIITFVRGAWCPYCMLELQAWSKFLLSIDTPINFIAVSGETSDLLALAKKDNNLGFSILEDKDYLLAKHFGLIYEVDEDMKTLLLKWEVDLTKRTCIDDFLLPIPATYILDKNHVIRYAFLEEDYTQRAEPQDVYTQYQKLIKTETRIKNDKQEN